MNLEALIDRYAGNLGNQTPKALVTAPSPALPGGNQGNHGNRPNQVTTVFADTDSAEPKAANDPPPPIHERSTVDQAGFRRAAEIISRVAGEFRLDPADVWGWLSLDDIKAIATVDPAELASLRAHCRPWKAQGSTTTGDHALPWPLGLLPPGEPMPVRCADCQHQRPTQHPVLIECGAGRQAPGACGMWWSLDQHHCTQFEGCQP